jgi:hypothetical protein
MNMRVASSLPDMPNLDFWTVARNTAVWWSPIVAGFIGAFGVHLLTQSREREKWILDSKKQEYRELLSALSQAHIITKSMTPGYAATINDPQEYSSITRVQNDSARIFSDRIFVVHDLNLPKLQRDWLEAMSGYAITMDGFNIKESFKPYAAFDTEYNRIKDEIVKAANRAVPKTALQRLMFWNK